MDDITHALVGWAVAEAGPARRWGGRATAALVLSSVVPDIDGILAFAGRSAYLLEHRGFTHSLIGLVPTALVVAGPLWRLTGKRDFLALAGLSFIGVALHIACDAVNAWGTMTLYPLTRSRVQLDWVFILDVVFTGIVLVAAVVARWKKSPNVARGGLAALACYVALCAVLHHQACRRVESLARDRGWQAVEAAALPMPPWAGRWSGLVVEPATIHQVWFDAGSGIIAERTRERPTARDLARIQSTADGRAFLKFARYPVVEREGARTVFLDARFTLPPGWPQHRPFALIIDPGREPAWAR